MALTCSICKREIWTKDERSIIRITSFMFYENWKRDSGNPTSRTRHNWCPECTRWFATQINERIEDVKNGRVVREKGYLPIIGPEDWGEVEPRRDTGSVPEA